MQFISQKNLKLTNIEFLCLKMAANPGESGRWYLRELHRYRWGTLSDGSWNAIYMSPSGGYRGKLFKDAAPKNRIAYGIFTNKCSRVGSFQLTEAGWSVAERAMAKLADNRIER